MQSLQTLLDRGARAAPPLGAPAVVGLSGAPQGERRHKEGTDMESPLSARLRALAMPMKVLTPPGTFASPHAPPGAPSGPMKVDHDGFDCSASTSLESLAGDGSSEASSEVCNSEACTTMAILNIPYTYPKWKLQKRMEMEGYTFDYFHFPRDSRRGRNRGFAFVNFPSPAMAQAFRKQFDNLMLVQPGEEGKAIAVVESSLQGFESNRALHPTAAAAAARPLRQRK